jgi:hypothetical protein
MTGRENGIPAFTTVNDIFPVAPVEEVVARTAKDLVLPVLSLETVYARSTKKSLSSLSSAKIAVISQRNEPSLLCFVGFDAFVLRLARLFRQFLYALR